MKSLRQLGRLRGSQYLGQLSRYVLTGGSAAVIDLGGFTMLIALRFPVAAAATCSFTLAALTNYVLTSRFVYGRALSIRRLVGFTAFALMGMMVNVGVTVAVAVLTGAPAVASKLVGIGTAFLLNFWVNSAFVFAGDH